MNVMRFLRSPALLFAAVFLAYVVARFAGELRPGTISMLGFATFGAIELVTVVWLLLQSPRRRALILSHGLNACGAFLISYSSLLDEALLPLALGAPLFVFGMLLWAKELQSGR